MEGTWVQGTGTVQDPIGEEGIEAVSMGFVTVV